MPKPHDLFKVWSADEAAECLDGVPMGVRNRLWNDIVPMYENQTRSEVPDDFGRRNLGQDKFWNKLSEEDQVALNAAAEAHDRQWRG